MYNLDGGDKTFKQEELTDELPGRHDSGLRARLEKRQNERCGEHDEKKMSRTWGKRCQNRKTRERTGKLCTTSSNPSFSLF